VRSIDLELLLARPVEMARLRVLPQVSVGMIQLILSREFWSAKEHVDPVNDPTGGRWHWSLGPSHGPRNSLAMPAQGHGVGANVGVGRRLCAELCLCDLPGFISHPSTQLWFVQETDQRLGQGVGTPGRD
jgi:hypothetical protein